MDSSDLGDMQLPNAWIGVTLKRLALFRSRLHIVDEAHPVDRHGEKLETGRAKDLRFSASSCWRKTRISASREART